MSQYEVKSDYDNNDGDDDGDIAYEVESDESEVIVDIDKNLGPDYKYAGQPGYWFYKVLRGDSPGRHLKRDIFFYSVIQFICSVVMLKSIDDASFYLESSKFLHHSMITDAYRELMWILGIAYLPFVLIGLIFVRHWASLCTNRNLLVKIMRGYCLCVLVPFLLTIVCTVLLFVGFKNAPSGAAIHNLFIASAIVLCLYLAATLAALMDILAYAEDVEVGGVIQEPNGPGPMLDLSGLTLGDGAMFCIALPLGAVIQLADMIGAVCRYSVRCVGGGRKTFIVRTTNSEGEIVTTTSTRRSTGCCVRCFKTIGRRISKFFLFQAVAPDQATSTLPSDDPDGMSPHDRLSHKLAELRKKRDSQQEDLSEVPAAEEGIDIEVGHTEPLEEAIADPIDGENAATYDNNSTNGNQSFPTTLTVTQYKAMWSSLESAGSFQCKLKEGPTIHKLSEHMRKQGFFVVFASSNAGKAVTAATSAVGDAASIVVEASAGGGAVTDSSSTGVNRVDIELGICNTRVRPGEPWFIARFIIANNIFSAVMKCQDAEEVQNYVKKFLLAKALRIDTSAAV